MGQNKHFHRTLGSHPCSCIFCDRMFASVFALRQHEQDAHGLKAPKRKRNDDGRMTEADWQTWWRVS